MPSGRPGSLMPTEDENRMTETAKLFDLPASEPSAELGKGTLWIGDARSVLSDFEDETFQTAVTSPPYWGLRDYGIDGQVGAEASVDDYIEHLVLISREVRRTLRTDGTFWLNIGDSYTSGGRTWRQSDKKLPARGMGYRAPTPTGLKPKDLVGVPWRVASALQRDGWYVRAEIIWHKPNGLPESVKDRPSRAHEFLFLLSKAERYYYDHDAVKQPSLNGGAKVALRDVWSINTEAFPDAHFATFPPQLVKPCVLAGSARGSSSLIRSLDRARLERTAREKAGSLWGSSLVPTMLRSPSAGWNQ